MGGVFGHHDVVDVDDIASEIAQQRCIRGTHLVHGLRSLSYATIDRLDLGRRAVGLEYLIFLDDPVGLEHNRQRGLLTLSALHQLGYHGVGAARAGLGVATDHQTLHFADASHWRNFLTHHATVHEEQVVASALRRMGEGDGLNLPHTGLTLHWGSHRHVDRIGLATQGFDHDLLYFIHARIGCLRFADFGRDRCCRVGGGDVIDQHALKRTDELDLVAV